MLIFTSVKKWIALFLVLQFGSNQTFARELVRLPILFIHYFEHKAKESHHHHHGHNEDHHDSEQGFGDFVADHYGDGGNKDTDHNHDHLPFKSSDCCSVLSVNIMLCGTVESISLVAHEENRTQHFIFNRSLKSEFHQHIWQPPKLI